jgi:hypothetical protein
MLRRVRLVALSYCAARTERRREHISEGVPRTKALPCLHLEPVYWKMLLCFMGLDLCLGATALNLLKPTQSWNAMAGWTDLQYAFMHA